MAYLRYALWVLLFVGETANASECLAFTSPRNLDLGGRETVYEGLDKREGHYIALFPNGDLLMAAFDQCGLGMHAHYYARQPLPPAARREQLSRLLAAVLPSRADYQRLNPKIPAPIELADGQPVVLIDEVQSHEFVFHAAESPLFATAVHYTWHPPEF